MGSINNTSNSGCRKWEHKSDHSGWIQENVPEECKITEIVNIVMESHVETKQNSWQSMPYYLLPK